MADFTINGETGQQAEKLNELVAGYNERSGQSMVPVARGDDIQDHAWWAELQSRAIECVLTQYADWRVDMVGDIDLSDNPSLLFGGYAFGTLANACGAAGIAGMRRSTSSGSYSYSTDPEDCLMQRGDIIGAHIIEDLVTLLRLCRIHIQSWLVEPWSQRITPPGSVSWSPNKTESEALAALQDRVRSEWASVYATYNVVKPPAYASHPFSLYVYGPQVEGPSPQTVPPTYYSGSASVDQRACKPSPPALLPAGAAATAVHIGHANEDTSLDIPLYGLSAAAGEVVQLDAAKFFLAYEYAAPVPQDAWFGWAWNVSRLQRIREAITLYDCNGRWAFN